MLLVELIISLGFAIIGLWGVYYILQRKHKELTRARDIWSKIK